MESIAKPALDAAAAFPYIQIAIGILTVIGGLYVITRGQRDNNTKPDAIPQWVLIGPMHDMMGAVHEVAEEARRTNDLLKDSNDILGDVLTEFRTARQTLEMIRNESRLR